MITERQTVKHEFFIVRKLKIHQLFETQLGHVDFWRILNGAINFIIISVPNF